MGSRHRAGVRVRIWGRCEWGGGGGKGRGCGGQRGHRCRCEAEREKMGRLGASMLFSPSFSPRGRSTLVPGLQDKDPGGGTSGT